MYVAQYERGMLCLRMHIYRCFPLAIFQNIAMLHAVHATVTGGTPQTGQISQNADLQLWLAARGLTPHTALPAQTLR